MDDQFSNFDKSTNEKELTDLSKVVTSVQLVVPKKYPDRIFCVLILSDGGKGLEISHCIRTQLHAESRCT